jgi:hypothetical protein
MAAANSAVITLLTAIGTNHSAVPSKMYAGWLRHYPTASNDQQIALSLP